MNKLLVILLVVLLILLIVFKRKMDKLYKELHSCKTKCAVLERDKSAPRTTPEKLEENVRENPRENPLKNVRENPKELPRESQNMFSKLTNIPESKFMKSAAIAITPLSSFITPMLFSKNNVLKDLKEMHKSDIELYKQLQELDEEEEVEECCITEISEIMKETTDFQLLLREQSDNLLKLQEMERSFAIQAPSILNCSSSKPKIVELVEPTTHTTTHTETAEIHAVETPETVTEPPYETTAETPIIETAVETAAEIPITETAVETAVEIPITETAVETTAEIPITETAVETAVETPITETAVETTVETPIIETTTETTEIPITETTVETAVETPITETATETTVESTVETTIETPPKPNRKKRSLYTHPLEPTIVKAKRGRKPKVPVSNVPFFLQMNQ